MFVVSLVVGVVGMVMVVVVVVVVVVEGTKSKERYPAEQLQPPVGKNPSLPAGHDTAAFIMSMKNERIRFN